MITMKRFGAAPDGREAHLFEISGENGTARVTDFGAALVGIDVPDGKGALDDVVLGFDSLAGYAGDNPACYGCTIGPSANRTDRAEVPIAGTVYRLPKNDGPDEANNLHTDLAHGLHKRLWDFSLDEGSDTVTFTCGLADGELGLPGARTFTASYHAADTDAGAFELTVTYGAESDAETYVNMTNHTYFNLAGHASGSVLDQVATIDADAFLPVREDSVSEGSVAAVAGTPFDFRAPKALGADIGADDEQLRRAHGYDHCFLIGGYREGGSPRHALRAVDPAGGRVLDILITAPAAHLYTGNWLGDTGAKGGASYAPRDGFAFEPEFRPDNVHHGDWEHPVCAPGHPYSSTIVYRLSA